MSQVHVNIPVDIKKLIMSCITDKKCDNCVKIGQEKYSFVKHPMYVGVPNMIFNETCGRT